ncbi:MAG: serine protease, partial [Actinomycetota bacterium]
MSLSGRLDRSIALVVAGVVIAGGIATTTSNAVASQRQNRATVVRLNDSRSFARTYWTKARMRNATSRSLIALKGRGPAPAGGPVETLGAQRSGTGLTGLRTAAASTAIAVDPTLYTTSPYSTAGRVFGTDAAGSFSCSGTAVNSANRSVVWTAGHCVIDPSTGYRATSLVFVPAYHNGAQPFGVWTATQADVPPQWSQVNGFPEGHDMAALVMGANSAGLRLTDVVGGRDIAFDQSQQENFDAYGYPAANPFNGGSLYHCLSNVVRVDNQTNPASLGISCDMTNGSSGGGWIIDGHFLNSNVTYFYTSSPGTLYGPYFGSGASGLFDEASTSTAPGPLPSGSPSPHPT